jgi:hypothetical protein
MQSVTIVKRNQVGGSLMLLGLTLVVIGVILSSRIKVPLLARLPADIFIDRENFKFFFPVTSSIVISLLLTLLLNLFKKIIFENFQEKSVILYIGKCVAYKKGK